MKYLILSILPALFPATEHIRPTNNAMTAAAVSPAVSKEVNTLNFQEKDEPGKMLATVFRAQQYCRAEVEDFVFDAPFKVVSATVYFSGANFRNVETGFINSNSLAPVKKLMERCGPGSIVIFDDVKVEGPDKQVRSIRGLSLRLH